MDWIRFCFEILVVNDDLFGRGGCSVPVSVSVSRSLWGLESGLI